MNIFFKDSSQNRLPATSRIQPDVWGGPYRRWQADGGGSESRACGAGGGHAASPAEEEEEEEEASPFPSFPEA